MIEQAVHQDHVARYIIALELKGYEHYPLETSEQSGPAIHESCGACGSPAIQYERFLREGERRTLAICLDCGYYAWREIVTRELNPSSR